MAPAEPWSRRQGYREIASDTWLDNVGSQTAHQALGFEVVDRCVNYRKALDGTRQVASADPRTIVCRRTVLSLTLTD
jgi:hypothetical protein